MMDYWQTVGDLLKGAQAVRDGGERYLPKFENETRKQYQDRLRWARYTNVYGDIVNNLASKPFSQELTLQDPAPIFVSLAEDIDGQNNNLHNFAAEVFKNAINFAIDWIYVDYTRVDPYTVDAQGRTRRKSVVEERQEGARPYWVRIPAMEMIAAYSAKIDGVEQFVHCRMLETYTERDGFGEKTVTQVRELTRDPVVDEEGTLLGFGPAYFRIWQQVSDQWSVIDEGPIAIGIIAVVPIVIGDRQGNTWRIIGEMNDCADLQIDLYQQETALQNARQLTAFPMLSADNVEPPTETYTDEDGNVKERPVPAPVGPRAVLYGGRNADGTGGSWKYIEITASSLKFLSEEIKSTTQELRELGRQPLTAQTGNLTTITTAFAAQKGNSAVQNWALILKDGLEIALKYTAMWIGLDDGPGVNIFTDFQKGIGEDDGFDDVLTMRQNGDLSQETLWEEAARRGRLGDEFTVERERDRLVQEEQDKPDEQDLIAALGNNPPPPPVEGENEEENDDDAG